MIAPIPKVAKRPRANISEERYRDSVLAQVRLRALPQGFTAYPESERPPCECCKRDAGIEMHECRFRSQTRNMPPEHRFDSRWSLWVCRWCHDLLQKRQLNVFCRSLEDGCDGLVVFLPGKTAPTSWQPVLDVWCHATGRTP